MTGSLCVLSEKLCAFAVKLKKDDQATSKKAFTNLGTVGSADPRWDHCWMDGRAEEDDARTTPESSTIFNLSHNCFGREGEL